MSATLEVFQERSNIPGGHRVETIVISSVLIPKELFVLRQEDDTFSHVAVISDLVYPTYKDNLFSYYRVASVSRDFEEITTAIDYASHVKYRLEQVALAYTQEADSFVGSETTILP